MNWIHSSRAVVLGVLLAVALLTAGTVGAVQIAGFDEAPDSAEVGEEVTVEVELTDLYGDNVPDDEWTLTGESGLDGADWTVLVRDAGGDEVERVDPVNESFEVGIDRDANHVTVDISVTGEIPEIDEFDYEDPEVEEILAMELAQLTADGDRATLADGTHYIHAYTEESREARTAIDDAREAAEDADSDSARDDVDDAITFYNNAEFESAANTANSAQESVESSQQTRQLLIFGGAAVVVVGLLVGVIYYWRESQKPTSKLQ